MKSCRFIVTSFIALLFVSSAWAGTGKSPKYVFLFIGDGMSTPQRMVAEEFSLKTGHGPLAMNMLPYHATTRTRSANKIITDSAAAATAIGCGVKTNNGMLGMEPDGTKVVSCAELAKKAGRKVGIITTVTIVHATPAGFYAHRSNRGMSYQIGLDLVDSGFEYFAGGGLGGKHDDRGNPEYRGDIFDLARKAGYAIATNRAEWAALKPGGKSWSVFATGAMDFAIDANGTQPTLPELVQKGIELLDSPAGFFMMCEGGKVDYCCHANDAATTLRDVIALDDAVKVAIAFADRHPDDTLIIVTGDHETGGLSMGFAGTGGRFYVERLASQKCSVESFSGTIKVMLRANVDRPFDDVKPLVTEKFGLLFDGPADDPMKMTKAEIADLEKAFEADRARVKGCIADTTAHDVARKYVFGIAVRRVLAAHAGIGWSSGSHTALPTLTTARGVCADILVGMAENDDLGTRLKKLYEQ